MKTVKEQEDLKLAVEIAGKIVYGELNESHRDFKLFATSFGLDIAKKASLETIKQVDAIWQDQFHEMEKRIEELEKIIRLRKDFPNVCKWLDETTKKKTEH